MKPDRFEIKLGDFYEYIWDTVEEKELSLDAVVEILNEADKDY